jgi:hypothetical protein
MRVADPFLVLLVVQTVACVQDSTPRAARHDLEAIATEFDVVAVRDLCVPRQTSSGRLRKVVRDISSADPWGNPYIVSHKDGKTVVLSLGKDGRLGTNDDITSRSVYAPVCSGAEE